MSEDEMADHGLHKLIQKIIVNKDVFKCHDAKILILGSGKGGLDRLLLQSGYTNIISVDVDKNNYNSKLKTKFIKADLNNNFNWSKEKYDLIIACEIIEHLENTAHFIREIKNKLKLGGLCILTTPNILTKTSISNLIMFGYLSAFTKNSFEWGHINPIFPHILEHHLEKEGLEIRRKIYNRKYFSRLKIYSYKSYLYYVILWIFSNIVKLFSTNKDNIEGVINIYEVRKR